MEWGLVSKSRYQSLYDSYILKCTSDKKLIDIVNLTFVFLVQMWRWRTRIGRTFSVWRPRRARCMSLKPGLRKREKIGWEPSSVHSVLVVNNKLLHWHSHKTDINLVKDWLRNYTYWPVIGQLDDVSLTVGIMPSFLWSSNFVICVMKQLYTLQPG